MKNNYNKMYSEQRGLRTESPVVDEVIPKENIDEVKDILETVAPPKEPKRFKIVNCTNLNLREKADRTSSVKTILKAGEIVTVESSTEDWAHVYTDNGVEGYVMKEFIEEV